MSDVLYSPDGRKTEVATPVERVRLLAAGYTARDPNPKPATKAKPVEPKKTDT